jgi:hypothetical protein
MLPWITSPLSERAIASVKWSIGHGLPGRIETLTL